MSDVRVRVDRARPTCPFCKDEVASGHVWVCPGCEASHHAACHDEHAACASCALAEPRAEVSTATKGDAPADDDPGGLLPRRRELERLGFTVVREATDELVATRRRWRHHPLMWSLSHTVIVRRVPRLTLARLETDLAALRVDPLASTVTVPVYLADVVDPDARRFVEAGRAVGRGPFDRVGLFPVVRDAATGTGSFLTFTPSRLPLGLAAFPGARHLARRLLYPWLDPAANAEPLPLAALVGVLVAIAILVTAVALTVRDLS